MLTHPFLAFRDRGYSVDLFSPSGGKCEADSLSDPRDPSGYSSDDLISMGFIVTPKLFELTAKTRRIADLRVGDYDAFVVVGGQAPMFTFEAATESHKKFIEFIESGKVTAALCNGTAILRYARLSNGEMLVSGKTVTGFANIEENFADNAVWEINALSRDTHVMPWRIEDELKALGANYIRAGLWQGQDRSRDSVKSHRRRLRHRSKNSSQVA